MGMALDWSVDGVDWPHREASRFVQAGGMRWHVQEFGADPAAAKPGSTGSVARPVALLLHGTGASTHTWRGLAPLLAAQYRVLAIDLPGHGFTATPETARFSLPGMAAAVGALLNAVALTPALIVGHSAGAAVAVRMALDRLVEPTCIVSLNGALLPLDNLAGQLFSPLAKLLALNPLVPSLFSLHARRESVVTRLISGTGSHLDAEGIRWYARLARSPGHVAGALRMMAAWDLHPLARELPRLTVPLVLIAGDRDAAIAPDYARRVKALLPSAHLIMHPGAGHLSHEEDAHATLALMQETLTAR